MSYIDDMREVGDALHMKDYDRAQKKLEDMLESSTQKEVEDSQFLFHSFGSVVEHIIYLNFFHPKKENKLPEQKTSEIYLYLADIAGFTHDYDKAIELLEESLKWNPVDPFVKLDYANMYRQVGNLERFRSELEKTWVYVYDSRDLAKFYRDMGWYYIERERYDIANALYSISMDFERNELAVKELKYIAEKEDRDYRLSTKDEINKLLVDYNIPRGFNPKIVKILEDNYDVEIKRKDQRKKIIEKISRTLYDMTLNQKYMIYQKVIDKDHNIEMLMPETWRVVEKSKFKEFGLNENTAMLFQMNPKSNLSIILDEDCTEEELSEKYNKCIEDMKKYGIEVVSENAFNDEDNNREIKQAILEFKEGDNTKRMFQNFIVVGNKLLKISWEVPQRELIDTIYRIENRSIRMRAVKSIKTIN